MDGGCDIVQETGIKTIPMEKELRNIHSHDIPKIQLKKEKKCLYI